MRDFVETATFPPTAAEVDESLGFRDPPPVRSIGGGASPPHPDQWHAFDRLFALIDTPVVHTRGGVSRRRIRFINFYALAYLVSAPFACRSLRPISRELGISHECFRYHVQKMKDLTGVHTSRRLSESHVAALASAREKKRTHLNSRA